MSAKEKAEELLRIFYNQMGMPLDCEWNDDCYNKFKDRNGLAKTCALIAVDEILEIVKSDDSALIVELPYWEEVRKEIEKI